MCIWERICILGYGYLYEVFFQLTFLYSTCVMFVIKIIKYHFDKEEKQKTKHHHHQMIRVYSLHSVFPTMNLSARGCISFFF